MSAPDVQPDRLIDNAAALAAARSKLPSGRVSNWWCPPTIGFSEALDGARQSLARTGITQLVHTHRKGEACTPDCRRIEAAAP
jgi:hypothetical protein